MSKLWRRPKKTVGVDRTQAKSIVGAAPFPHAAGVPPDQDEMIITEQLDFSSLLFGNPVLQALFGLQQIITVQQSRPGIVSVVQ